jgi:hypothetical protein
MCSVMQMSTRAARVQRRSLRDLKWTEMASVMQVSIPHGARSTVTPREMDQADLSLDGDDLVLRTDEVTSAQDEHVLGKDELEMAEDDRVFREHEHASGKDEIGCSPEERRYGGIRHPPRGG